MMSNGTLTRALIRVFAIVSTVLLAGCGGGGGDNSTPPPVPIALTTLTPGALNAGAPTTVITAAGSGFTVASVLEWNGTALITNYVSATSLTATVPAADLAAPGTASVTVAASASGGIGSAVVDFTISEQTAPTIASLAPSTVAAGNSTFQLLVSGTNFLSTATVLWNGSALPTTFGSATQLTAQVTAAQVAAAGNASVTVLNDAAAGGTSNVSTFSIGAEPPLLPVPTVTALSPMSIQSNTGSVTLTLTGTNFTPTTAVSFNGGFPLSPTSVSSTQLTVTFFSAYQSGSVVNVAVSDPASGYTFSNSLQLSIIPPTPVISSIAPATITAAQLAIPLTVSGQYFSATSVVYFNGSARPTTMNQSGGLVVQLTAADVSSAGTEAITVEDPAAGNMASNTASLVVQPLPAVALNTLSPATVPAGNANFTLTVFGVGFTPNSMISWNGTTLTTTYVSTTTLQASVDSTRVATTGMTPITVVNSANQGGTSAPQTLTVAAPSKDAVSYQINNAHTGSIVFNSVSLPSAASWSVNLGGAPSFALIVGQRVFVMAAVSGNSQVSALDAATGASIWGPIAFSGIGGIGYDAGTLFVNSGTFASNGILTALDATTGSPKWSATIPGVFAGQSPPVAAQGLVYMLEDGDLTAFDEASGAQVWQGGVTGTNGAVAVTVDGVYVSQPCTAVDYQPVSGATIWFTNTGCDGGGGDTPVVSGNKFYAPIGGFFSGNTYDAESGVLLGGFGYSAPPAINASSIFVLRTSTLQGITLSNNQVNWSFAGDGVLVTAPIVVNNYVFVGSSAGNLYALDATSGAQVWTKNLGAAIPFSSDNSGGNGRINSGLSAGGGLLIVPAGNTINAFVLSTNP